MRALDVWMAGTHIATVTESRGKMKLNYVPGVAPLGVPLISVAMPMSSAPYTDKVVRPFFHGLLPEGTARQTIAYDFGVDAGAFPLVSLMVTRFQSAFFSGSDATHSTVNAATSATHTSRAPGAIAVGEGVSRST